MSEQAVTAGRIPETLAGPVRASGSDDTMPKRIGRYTLLQPIGQGGMGVVYLAHDPELDRRIAIKLLREHVTARLEAQGDGSPLIAEARLMAKLNHPNVVTVFDVGHIGDRIFIAMEYVEGDTLDVWLRGRRLAWREAVRLFVAAARGLSAAHGAGIVHRDFKPANVFVSKDGTVRVGDFGLARPATSGVTQRYGSDDTLTENSTVVGTPAYMAPEQHMARHTDARADQFAFCTALYEAVYRRRPFKGRSVISLAHQKIGGKVEPPPRGTGVPKWLHDVILRGLASDPAERFASIDAMVAALERPMRPRRSMLVWGSGIIPLVALGIVLGLTGGDANRCGTGHFDGVWDRTRKHEIEEQFTSSGQGYAKRSFEIAAGRLDTWQGEWEGAHKQACEAFADDPVKLDRRVGCLQRKLSEFRALADVFATADVDVVVGATRATAHLPEIPRCMSPRAHTPEPTALQASVQKRIDEARALHYAGRYEDALLVASVALRDAEMDGSPALRARALYRVGAARFRRAHYEDALQALDGAVWLASEAGLDDLAAAAATLLVPIVGRRLGRPKQGEQWGRHASTFLARSGDEPLARARLANNLGQVDEAAGALEAARRRYEDAQAIKQTLLPNDHPERATTLLNLGAVAGKLGQMQAAREHLERSLEILERAHGPEHPALAGPLTNLGNVARATGDLEQAAARYLRAVEIREAAEGPTSPTLAAPLSNLGVVKSAMGQHAEAEDLHARAAALYEAAHGREHPRVASAFINRGDAAFRLGRLDAAAEDFVTAAEILAVAAPEHAMRLTALNNLGEVHLAAEHWEAARVAYDEAWAWAKARAAPKMAAARAAAGLGRGLVELDRGPEAVEPLSWALETLTKAGSPAGPLAKTEALLARAKG